MASYLLQENADNLVLEDGSGYLLLELSEVTTTPTAPAAAPGRHARISPPALEHFLAGTARILLRSGQPSLILVPTASPARVSLRAKQPGWEQILESSPKRTPIIYRAARDDFDELVQTAYLLTRDFL